MTIAQLMSKVKGKWQVFLFRKTLKLLNMQISFIWMGVTNFLKIEFIVLSLSHACHWLFHDSILKMQVQGNSLQKKVTLLVGISHLIKVMAFFFLIFFWFLPFLFLLVYKEIIQFSNYVMLVCNLNIFVFMVYFVHPMLPSNQILII